MLVVKPVALCTCDKELHGANNRIRIIGALFRSNPLFSPDKVDYGVCVCVCAHHNERIPLYEATLEIIDFTNMLA